ncbi:MAG: membrane protein insertase YidC [Leptospira sp.]|nr:membrane protein insertase YidC [Leptospira sp.]
MQERQGRLFFALFISLGIWLALQYFFFPPEKKPLQPTDKVTQTDETDTSDSSEKKLADGSDKSSNQVTSGGKSPAPTISSKPVPKPVDPASVKKYYIKTDPYLIEMSSLGGRISQFYIKNHLEPDGNILEIVKDPKRHTIEFDGESYMAIEISRNNGFDFNPIFAKDDIPDSEFNYKNFASLVNEESLEYNFESLSNDGSYTLIKKYRFFPKENYFIFHLEIKNNTKEKLILANTKNPLYLRSFGSLGPITKTKDEMSDRDMANFFRYFYLDGSFEDFLDGTSTEGFFSNMFGGAKPEDTRFEIKKATSKEGVDFAGTGSRYFIAVLDPLSYNPEGVLLDNRVGNQTGVLMIYDEITLEPGEITGFDYAAYVGVREPDGLAFRDANLDPVKNKKSPFFNMSDALDKSFNQGLTTPFRNGIVWVLKKIHIVVPNYGWAIIIFAILFKLIFFPLNQKQADSMKKMQELSPQIKEINEKYGNDPQVKQTKIMELYKKNKVNPMGGCLPMLIQIPIFIALYTAFSDTVDLWESPFLWVADLSEPDTIFVLPPIMGVALNVNLLPLIMVGSQVLQSRLTVVSTDPNQKMMMYMMPIIMLYFFWSMPSGVTLYWTMQNLLSILQQVITNKYGKDAKLKRLEKANAGSGTGGDSYKTGPANAPQAPASKRTPPRKRRKK